MKRIKNLKFESWNLKIYLCLAVFLSGSLFFYLADFKAQKIQAEDLRSEIEKAIFTRQEFFGSEAIVPLPTTEAREKLVNLSQNQPDNPLILEKLAELSEKLEKFDEAEKSLIRLAEIDSSNLDRLSEFYHSHAKFEKEAEVLEKILFIIDTGQRGEILQRLLDLARIHDLKKYLQNDFLSQVIQANPESYEIFEKLIDKFTEEKNYDRAIKTIRQAKANFPSEQSVLLDKEIEILLNTEQPKEAEKVYQAAFDPFWSEAEADKFYDFLSDQDRLRLYGAEIKEKFRQNPADFDAAIRLGLYQNHDYRYGNDDLSPIVLKLEKAKKNWTTEELVTVTRLLLQANQGEVASRFLYTLYLREDFKKSSELRRKILYQLFEMFSDADEQKLPISKGDLSFYEDIAKTDTNPGISTGVLSLIFSDTNPREKLTEQETKANKYFNRAAAYRIFTEYKTEFPTSPELAQMYLDLVRRYTANKETEMAEKTLNEFAERFEKSDDYAVVAMKLADAFAAAKQNEKMYEVYQKTLDYLGKNQKLNSASGQTTENEGIKIPNQVTTTKNEHSYKEQVSNFHDYLGREKSEITYRDVLEKYVAWLLKDKKTTQILALYSDEINKYPDQEWLYEKRLGFLESTNYLVEEQLKVYQTALNRFQTNNWRDKLARWFLRQKRQAEFANFSSDLVSQLNDEEIQSYLSQFTGENTYANQFERELFLKLYQTAHQRFPHNLSFVDSLLQFYQSEKDEIEWRKLAAEYFFVSKEIRQRFLDRLAKKSELRDYLAKADSENIVYELFRADASIRLSNYEKAITAYRKLNQIYPHTPEFSERLISFTRSFGQRNRAFLSEAADVSQSNADFQPSSASARTRNGEIQAELGNYPKAREEWEKLIALGTGDKETYLETATLYWDYFQYHDAWQTINKLRKKVGDETLYAFEAGAILEAQNQPAQAIGQYVKAFGNEEQREKAKRRLRVLIEKNREILPQITSAFETEKRRREDASFVSLGYAELLFDLKNFERGESILNSAISTSRNTDFLEDAQEFYQSNNNFQGEQGALRRLAEITENSHQKISYRLQLAESFEQHKERNGAKNELNILVQTYPTNFGVITEASDFYWRLGFENESATVLSQALPKSKGKYQTRIAQKLSKRLIQQNKLDSAEQILLKLHQEHQANTGILHDLAELCIRTENASLMKKTFDETILALKQSDQDRREVDAQIADLRLPMIDAFTRLKDYNSAVEQHIEIINREPDEENTEKAIRYVQRYGGAETLLNYYQKLSTDAFKNYRWNVVLARLYEANKDSENAVKNYQTAIVNQPEMPELYLAIADIETRRNNFEAALKNIDEVLTLTNDEAIYVKKKIEILKKAGRTAEIEAEKAKLPPEPEKKEKSDEFTEARNLAATEKEKARQIYRAAFVKLLESPLKNEFNTADLTAYAQSMREEVPLDQINQNFWNLRETLMVMAEGIDSKNAGQARTRIGMLDTSIVESVGTIAKNVGTDEELTALHEDLKNRLENSSNDQYQTLSLIQNFSQRVGFGDLEELILQKKLDKANSDSEKSINKQNLINFYQERGAYQKTFEVLEKYGSDNSPLKAETARLIGNREGELEALRQIYWKPGEKAANETNPNVTRFLEILYAENRIELQSLTEKTSVFQLQLINFLLSKGERELVHQAIKNSSFSNAWKVSRSAETSLALKEFDPKAECYFCEALQFDSIGNLQTQWPDKSRFLINDDWFRLSREYGEWLFERKDKEVSPAKYLVAMIENQPNNAEEQFKLGEFYLQKNEFTKAIEHFRLAIEVDNLPVDDNAKLSNLGTAYYLSGNKGLAEETWADTIADEQYFQTLQRYGLTEKAREKMLPTIVSFLKERNIDSVPEMQSLVRLIAKSFTAEDAKTKYFQAILQQRPTDTSLAEMLLNEGLIARSHSDFFYQRLIDQSEAANSSDYDFETVSERIFDHFDAESVYEQENDYKSEEPESDQLKWQRNYLEILLIRQANNESKQIITEIEKELNKRYVRPTWLRLAKLNLQFREGHSNLAEAKRFIGITVSDSATETIPPNLERLNEVLQIANESQKIQLSEAFFARMLALEQLDAANLVGLSRALFQKGETEKGLQVLRLMIDAGDEAKRQTALAEIASLESVKSQSTKLIQNNENINLAQTQTLRLAAEIAAEFKRVPAAIEFRHNLKQINKDDQANQIELAKLLTEGGQKAEAVQILRELITDKNALRQLRWQSRIILRNWGETVDLPDLSFDVLSQFYQSQSANSETARQFLINALISDKGAETIPRQELIENYALTNLPFAALKLAETDKSAKSDELLQMLSESAEKIGNYAKAIEFEKSKINQNQSRINHLQQLANEQNKRATDFSVNADNTRKL